MKPQTPKLKLAELERIATRVLKMSDADETEVDVSTATDALTRFANNTIHQNVAEDMLGISVRVDVDGRTARASTNKTDDESLRRAVASAVSLARNQPENPDLLPMLRAQKFQKVARFFPATAAATPQDRARAVTRVCKLAEKNKQTAAGIFASGSSQSVMANSKGLFAHYEQTRVGILSHDSRKEFVGLGQVQFAGHPHARSRRACRERQPKSHRIARAA